VASPLGRACLTMELVRRTLHLPPGLRALLVALGIATPLEVAETPIGQGVVYVFREGRITKHG
jgi:hypothetical protein